MKRKCQNEKDEEQKTGKNNQYDTDYSPYQPKKPNDTPQAESNKQHDTDYFQYQPQKPFDTPHLAFTTEDGLPVPVLWKGCFS